MHPRVLWLVNCLGIPEGQQISYPKQVPDHKASETELQLMEILRQRHHAWITQTRNIVARKRFITALHTFIALVFMSNRDDEA